MHFSVVYIKLNFIVKLNDCQGGFKATVWTQVFHFIWITLFLFVLAVVSAIKAGGFMHAFELAAENGRLDWE